MTHSLTHLSNSPKSAPTFVAMAASVASLLMGLFASTSALAQAQAPTPGQVFRCSSGGAGVDEYINNAKDALARNCKLMQGGNITIVQSSPIQNVNAAKAPVRVAANSSGGAISGPRNDGGTEQKARDSDSRGILESELRKAEAKLAELQKEYNNGEPEKQGIEGRNYQRYLDRVAELKDGINRNQSDVAGLKRELSRLPPVN
jgi:hypothetical protein